MDEDSSIGKGDSKDGKVDMEVLEMECRLRERREERIKNV